jgi:hypothetical protein
MLQAWRQKAGKARGDAKAAAWRAFFHWQKLLHKAEDAAERALADAADEAALQPTGIPWFSFEDDPDYADSRGALADADTSTESP